MPSVGMCVSLIVLGIDVDCFLTEKRLQQLEEFRQRKALEKSARAERIKQRVLELQDKRRMTIARIRSDIGANYEEKNAARTSTIEQTQKKSSTAFKKTSGFKAHSVSRKTVCDQTKGTALLVKKGVNKLTSGLDKSEVHDTVDSKPKNSRRLTMTLSESFIKSSGSKDDLVEQKENKMLLHKPQQCNVLPAAKAGSKTELQPFSATIANVCTSSVYAAKSVNGVAPARTNVPRKRLVTRLCAQFTPEITLRYLL
jgi:hypothetical protein